MLRRFRQSRSARRAPMRADDSLVFDFDGAGRLVGIEFLTPEQRLLPSVLAAAERSTRRPNA